jgi:hypothetical protein
MSLLKANAAQLGQSGTATQNFTLDATAADGTMKLARGNAGATTQDILTVDASGFLSAVQPPVQFDTSLKLATTAFVKSMGLTYGGIVTHAGTEAILAADMGKMHFTSAAGATTLTLPAANTVPVGTTFTIMGSASGVATIQRAGADSLLLNGSVSTSVTCGNGDFLTFTTASSSQWYAFGSAQLGSSTAFGSLMSANGYQKLPSGLIIQWGVKTTSALSTTYTTDAVTFPIAFPTAVLGRTGSFGSGAGASWLSVTLEASGTPLTSMNIRAASGSALAAQPFNWIAIGY